MKSTGLQRFETATVDTFTSDIGLKICKSINFIWRRILKLGIRRKVFTEKYPKLDKKKQYIFVCNHSFDEDVWKEELTMYSGHGVTTPRQAREYVDQIRINPRNAGVLADVLVRREEDKRYDLEIYLRNNIKLRK